jgi:hypothetical protein
MKWSAEWRWEKISKRGGTGTGAKGGEERLHIEGEAEHVVPPRISLPDAPATAPAKLGISALPHRLPCLLRDAAPKRDPGTWAPMRIAQKVGVGTWMCEPACE